MDPGIKKQEGYQNVPMDHIDCFCFLPVENTGNGKELAKNRKNSGSAANARRHLPGDRSHLGAVILQINFRQNTDRFQIKRNFHIFRVTQEVTEMFLVREIFRSICRRKGFSLLTAMTGVFLFLSLGIYIGNLNNIRNALETLGEKLPVTVQITNANGSQDIGLEIRAAQFDAFAGSGVRDLVYTAQAGGNREEKGENGPVPECDTSIKAANSLDAFANLREEDFSFAKGYDISYLSSREPWCTICEQYGSLYGIETGDSLELSVYQIKYKGDAGSFQFLPLGRASLKVIGVYRTSRGFALRRLAAAVYRRTRDRILL